MMLHGESLLIGGIVQHFPVFKRDGIGFIPPPFKEREVVFAVTRLGFLYLIVEQALRAVGGAGNDNGARCWHTLNRAPENLCRICPEGSFIGMEYTTVSAATSADT